MLYAFEFQNRFTRCLTIHQISCRNQSCCHIFEIVNPTNFHLFRIQNMTSQAIFAIFNFVIIHNITIRKLAFATEKHYVSRRFLLETFGDFVVIIQNQQAIFILVLKNIFLGFNIFFHAFMFIQMIWRNIGNDSNIWANFHIHQLKTAQLQHNDILWCHFAYFRKQWRSNIATQKYVIFFGF